MENQTLKLNFSPTNSLGRFGSIIQIEAVKVSFKSFDVNIPGEGTDRNVLLLKTPRQKGCAKSICYQILKPLLKREKCLSLAYVLIIMPSFRLQKYLRKDAR